MKLMLALRRALFDSTWEQIIDGCKNYQKYCQAGGIEGSAFVQAPTRYIEDGSYLETFTHQAAEDPKKVELKRLESERMQRAVERAIQTGSALRPHPQEPAAAFETRIDLERTHQRGDRTQPTGFPAQPDARLDAVGRRVSSLADRMRIAK
jgi:hypothetical protein